MHPAGPSKATDAKGDSPQVSHNDPEAQENDDEMHVSDGSHEEEEEFDFGEVLVHQVGIIAL